MSGGVDRDDTRDLEVPEMLGSGKWSNESTGRGINVNGHMVTGATFIFIQQVRHLFHRFVVTSISAY